MPAHDQSAIPGLLDVARDAVTALNLSASNIAAPPKPGKKDQRAGLSATKPRARALGALPSLTGSIQ